MSQRPHSDGAHRRAVSSASPLSWAAFVVVFYHSHGLQNEDSFPTCSVVFGLGSSVLEFCRNRTLGRSCVAISIHSLIIHLCKRHSTTWNCLYWFKWPGCKRALESRVCGRSRCKGWTFSVAFLAIWGRTTTVCHLKCWTIRFLNSVELCSQPSVHTRNRSPLPYGNRSGWCPPKYHKNVHTLHKALCANSITFLPRPSPS